MARARLAAGAPPANLSVCPAAGAQAWWHGVGADTICDHPFLAKWIPKCKPVKPKVIKGEAAAGLALPQGC